MRLALILFALVARPALCQTDPTASGWGGTIGLSVDLFEADREAWQRSRVSVQRRFEQGAVSVEVGHTRRNGETSARLGADLYRAAGRHGYGNLRIDVSPGAQAVAQVDVLGEVYAALGEGWEASVGARHVAFEADDVTLGTASLAKYAGNWLARARVVVTPGDATAVSTVGTVRYLFEGVGGLTAPFVEITAGQGQEPIVGPDGRPSIRQSWVIAGRGQRIVRGAVGVALGLSYTADGTLTRWGVDAGIVARL